MLKSLKSRLPPANALIVFESAARCLNFTTASHELAIAQPAVTRQIKKLEHNLGTSLFIRQNNKLQLTKDGEALKKIATRALGDIAECAVRMRGTKDRVTNIGSTFAFANLWLVPRLTRLRALLGQTTLNLVITDNLEELDQSDVSFSFRFGRGDWDGMDAHLLFTESVFPVASPQFIAQHKITASSRWHGDWLIELDMPNPGWISWAAWLARTGNSLAVESPAQLFESYLFVIDAAKQGKGIALGFQHLMGSAIERGELIAIGPKITRAQAGYYVVAKPGNKNLPGIVDSLKTDNPDNHF